MSGLVVASSNGRVGIRAAIEALRRGGSAADAVVAGIEPVEANPDDHSVGYSGLPNLLGEVELDASIMEGDGLRAGAVGALQRYRDAIALARAVMEELPHVLIGGQGAARFAAEMGLTASDLLTPEAERLWRERLEDSDSPSSERYAYYRKVRELIRSMTDVAELVEPPHGTVNFIARDREGNLACGVSTSGWAWKYPGRMGDSPVIGAGNYADNRWGAAACTGRGEMTLRCCSAHSIVTFLRFGMPLPDALRLAMEDLRTLDDPYASTVNMIALDKDGNHGATSTVADRTYIVMGEDMENYEELPRTHVPLAPTSA